MGGTRFVARDVAPTCVMTGRATLVAAYRLRERLCIVTDRPAIWGLDVPCRRDVRQYLSWTAGRTAGRPAPKRTENSEVPAARAWSLELPWNRSWHNQERANGKAYAQFVPV